ncbi:DUF397 domain-containing protein [Saccharothrix coeruleofusca]|uniref:Toxin n=1 Tax=Saccharothrix coeruleofusca TaxID=33919 RepID=A0A918ATL0_9PSEU|nr:DUF397 domain-containing protein [Saccharothrix coeruleofusca]GGP70089.1 toxin [Saccharothrix coeruleofusca]
MAKSELIFGIWHTSSYSGANSNCVEVAWNKSSHSGGNSNCVEVAHGAAMVGVRDSKKPGAGVVTVSRGAWAAFLAALR